MENDRTATPADFVSAREDGRAGPEASEVGLAAVASVFPKFDAVMSEHDEAEARRTAESMKANVTISWPKSRL